MKLLKVLFVNLIIFFFGLSCSRPIQEKSNVAIDSLKEKSGSIEEVEVKNNQTSYSSVDCYTADELVYAFVNFLNSDSTFLCVKSNYFLEKRLVDNIHVSNQVDSIYYLSSDLNELEYYVTHFGKRLFKNGQIKGNDLCVDDKIQIGALKEIVFSNSDIKIESLNDIVRVCDTEQTVSVNFYFKNDLLEKVNVKNSLD